MEGPPVTADPTPTPEDYRRADLLIAGMRERLPELGAADKLRELFAGGIAVARAGGDVEAFLRRHAQGKP
jgi:hypothetical protein